MPSRAQSEPQITVFHGDQVPARRAMEEIGTQMAPLCEAVSGSGLTGEQLVTRPALCQSPGPEQHGVDSEEEALGILPMHHSYDLSACHTPGSG